MTKECLVRICPICGSTNVKSIYLISPSERLVSGAKKFQERFNAHSVGSVAIGWQPQNPSVFICMDCDYNGICPEIEISQVKEFKKELKKIK
ncbi:MAG: hypothetical protein KKF89_06290 [Nanoarchaeota archaeon]|nr:hypothetical protein [Nanoarchaeota archaeon]MBU1855307.1 hypothetical protein [Nanoarchaeota archaeon]